MAIITVDKSKNPKAVVSVNDSLNYTDKDGVLQEKQLKSVATEVIREAASVATMNKGAVTIAFDDGNGNYKNYFVNKNPKNEAIILVPIDTKDYSDTFIYLNKHLDKDDKGNIRKTSNGNEAYFYSLNNSTEAGQNFENSLSARAYSDKEGNERKSLNVRVTLANKELVAALKEKGENALAVISKDDIKITTKDEHYKKQDRDNNISFEKQVDKNDIDR